MLASSNKVEIQKVGLELTPNLNAFSLFLKMSKCLSHQLPTKFRQSWAHGVIFLEKRIMAIKRGEGEELGRAREAVAQFAHIGERGELI